MVALRPSRRAILGTLTAAGAASAVGVYFWTIGADALIGKILSRRLPGVRIDTVSIASLSRDVQATFSNTLVRRASLKGGALATRIAGIDALANFKLTAREFSRLERIVLTYFIFGSNFLDVEDPQSDMITYYRMPETCQNPFAEYDRETVDKRSTA
jgi:hypothetical protein